MSFEEMQGDTAGAASDIQKGLAFEVQAINDPVDFVRPAGGQVSFTPQSLQKADGAVVIFWFCRCRLDHRITDFQVPETDGKLAHSRQNATSFVEHSFNMAGQKWGDRGKFG
jgi:hypothetical protein